MFSDHSYDGFGSDSDSDWDTPQQTWSEKVQAEVGKLVREFAAHPSKRQRVLHCAVCVRNNRRGACPDVKALVQHCATVKEHKDKHREFVEALKKGIEDGGYSLRSLEVGKFEPGASDVQGVTADDMGKVVVPFILLVENVPLDNGDVTFVGSREDCVKMMLEKQGVKNVSRAGLLPEGPDVLTTFGFKARAFATFEQHDDLNLAHESLRQKQCGRQDWKAHEGRLRNMPSSELLFGYKATVDDMFALDPGRKVVDWKVVDFKATCYLPEQKRLEQKAALNKQLLDFEAKEKKQAELRAQYLEGLKTQQSIFNQKQHELEAWNKKLDEAELVLQKEKEAYAEVWEKEVEKRRQDVEAHMQELSAVDDSQENSLEAQEKFIAAFVAMKDAQDDLEEAQKLQDEKIKEVFKQKRLVENIRSSSLADAKKRKRLADETLDIERRLGALEQQIAEKQASVADASREKEVDEETMEGVNEQFEMLEKIGLSLESLDQFDCAVCLLCGQKLLKPPLPSAEHTMPNYKEELLKSRSLLIPCCCATFCMKCAQTMQRKKQKCPKCTSTRRVTAISFQLFGFRD